MPPATTNGAPLTVVLVHGAFADSSSWNGVIERFMRTLKEQCLYLHRFQSLAEAHRLIGEFITRYNTEWLIERLGHQTPAGARIAANTTAITISDRVRLRRRHWAKR